MQAENIPKMAAAVAAVKGTQTDSCCSRSQQTTPGTNETAKQAIVYTEEICLVWYY